MVAWLTSSWSEDGRSADLDHAVDIVNDDPINSLEWLLFNTRTTGPEIASGIAAAAAIKDSEMPREILKRALSIRQPFSEQILLGKKKEEYRSRRTHIRGRVYLYAGKTIARIDGFTKEKAEALPRGVIVGSVEIVGCHEDEDCFAWELANPMRYRRPLVPRGVPQPGFWFPTF